MTKGHVKITLHAIDGLCEIFARAFYTVQLFLFTVGSYLKLTLSVLYV